MKKQGRPWSIGKSFEESAPIGEIVPAGKCSIGPDTAVALKVNGQVRQSSTIGKLIWGLPEIIAYVSTAWELKPGDLVYSGTPEGVAAVEVGDLIEAEVQGLPSLALKIVAY
jgi:fumarylpyruvate hydrolase